MKPTYKRHLTIERYGSYPMDYGVLIEFPLEIHML